MPKKRIIDQRKKEKFMMDDEYLNGQAKLCGIYATGVYLSLCRHANTDQESFPSIKLVSEELSISRDSVINGLKSLEKHRVIEIKKRRTKTGKWLNNIYVLLDKSEWSKYQVPHRDTDTQVDHSDMASQVDHSVYPSRPQRKTQVGHSDTKETQEEGNTLKETHFFASSKKDDADEINQIMEKFQMLLNSAINYGNKTQRKAIQELLVLMGKEKLLRTIEFAASVADEPYSPTITTPYQLKEKLAQLVAYSKKQQSKKRNITFIS